MNCYKPKGPRKLTDCSKRRLIRYVQLLRKHVEQAKVDLKDISAVFFAAVDKYNALEFEYESQEDYWHKRLVEAEEMFELKTANLQKHNEKLVELITKDAMLRTHPPIILKYEHPALAECKKLLADQLGINSQLTNEIQSLKVRLNKRTADFAAVILDTTLDAIKSL